jgi:hypothetical protein
MQQQLLCDNVHARSMQPVGFQINPTFSFTLLGTFVIFLWTRPPLAVWLWILPVAAGLRMTCAHAMGGLGTYFGVTWISWGTFLGIASLLVQAIRAILARADRRKDIRTFYAGAVFPLLAMVTGFSIPLNLWLRPKTFDAFLLAFDGALGFQPSFLLGKTLLKSYAAWGWTTVVYYALPLAGATLYASYRTRRHQPVAILTLLLSFMVIGFAQYGVYPAVGPGHAFGDFYPATYPPLASVTLQAMSVGRDPRNCMPSLHFGAALLVWWNSRIWARWGRALAGIFLLATAFSTLALGEHYLADLVVAFPFALVFQAGCTKAVPLASKTRYVPIIVGGILTVTWLVLLRFAIGMFELSAGGTWACVLVTVGWSMLLESRLAGECFPVQASGFTQHNEPASYGGSLSG